MRLQGNAEEADLQAAYELASEDPLDEDKHEEDDIDSDKEEDKWANVQRQMQKDKLPVHAPENSQEKSTESDQKDEEWSGIKTRIQRGIIPKKKIPFEQLFKQERADKPIKTPFVNLWRLGCHVRIDGFLDNAVLDAARIGAESFSLFLKPDNMCNAPPLLLNTVERFKNYMAIHGYKSDMILPHGSYLINLANPDKMKRTNALRILLDDLKRCGKLGLTMYNLHPGSTTEKPTWTERGLAQSIEYIAEGLNEAIRITAGRGNNVTILLENMAGHGATVAQLCGVQDGPNGLALLLRTRVCCHQRYHYRLRRSSQDVHDQHIRSWNVDAAR